MTANQFITPTVSLLRPPARFTPEAQQKWNADLLRNLQDHLTRMSQQIIFNQKEGSGILSAQAGSTAETTVDATPRKIAAWNTNGRSHLTTVDHTTDDITIDIAGTFLVNANVSFSGSAAKTFRLEIYQNGAASGFAVERKLGASGDVGSVSCNGLILCAKDDTIEVYQSSSDGGTVLTVTEAQLRVGRIDD